MDENPYKAARAVPEGTSTQATAQSNVDKASAVSVIIAVICFFVAVPGVFLGSFMGPHIVIPAVYCAALGSGFMYFAVKLAGPTPVGRWFGVALTAVTALSAAVALPFVAIQVDRLADSLALVFFAVALALSLYLLVLLLRRAEKTAGTV